MIMMMIMMMVMMIMMIMNWPNGSMVSYRTERGGGGKAAKQLDKFMELIV